MIFLYKARDPMGRTVSGELDGSDAAHIQRELVGRALVPIWVRPAKPGSSAIERIKETDVPFQDAAPDVVDQQKSPIGWGSAIFILIYILLQIFGLF